MHVFIDPHTVTSLILCRYMDAWEQQQGLSVPHRKGAGCIGGIRDGDDDGDPCPYPGPSQSHSSLPQAGTLGPGEPLVQMLLRVRDQCEVWRHGTDGQGHAIIHAQSREVEGLRPGFEQLAVSDGGKAARIEAKRLRRAARKLQKGNQQQTS